jgi:hypothetical protein
VPVAVFGRADSRQLFLTVALKSHIPIPAIRKGDSSRPADLSRFTFAWSDLNATAWQSRRRSRWSQGPSARLQSHRTWNLPPKAQ